MKCSMAPEPRPLLPYADCTARLRSSTAYLMLQLAHVAPGDVVLDPMCGIGTLPLVAAAQTCCGCAIAADIDEHVLRQAAANGRHLHAAHARAARDGAPHLALGDLVPISERRGLAPPETTPHLPRRPTPPR